MTKALILKKTSKKTNFFSGDINRLIKYEIALFYSDIRKKSESNLCAFFSHFLYYFYFSVIFFSHFRGPAFGIPVLKRKTFFFKAQLRIYKKIYASGGALAKRGLRTFKFATGINPTDFAQLCKAKFPS